MKASLNIEFVRKKVINIHRMLSVLTTGRAGGKASIFRCGWWRGGKAERKESWWIGAGGKFRFHLHCFASKLSVCAKEIKLSSAKVGILLSSLLLALPFETKGTAGCCSRWSVRAGREGK